MLTGILALVWSRTDAARLEREVAEVRAKDCADLQIGHSWGSLATDPYKAGELTEAARIPIENPGRRDGSISRATWAVVDEDGNLKGQTQIAYLEPVEEWPGRGGLTIPAGTRRMFRFPLNRAARAALDAGGTLHLYVLQVGADTLARGAVRDSGVEPVPWTDRETWESELAEQMERERAEFFEEQAQPSRR